MAIDTIKNSKFEKLAPVVEDCAQWFGQIAMAVAYPDQDTQVDKIKSPTSFREWILEVSQDEEYDKNVVSDISSVYNDMIDAGEDIVEGLRSRDKPELPNFENFIGFYNAFVSRLRWVEQDSVLSGSGICPETGFKSKEAIILDQKKEMERLKRQGTQFSMVMVRVDNFNAQTQSETLPLAVEAIKTCMRAFDDAYYLGEGYFLLSLKQTDLIGAEAATDRLEIILKEKNPSGNMSMSYCMAEPVEDDEVKTLLDSMKKDLDGHSDQQNVSLKFVESSPLQQYVDSLNG